MYPGSRFDRFHRCPRFNRFRKSISPDSRSRSSRSSRSRSRNRRLSPWRRHQNRSRSISPRRRRHRSSSKRRSPSPRRSSQRHSVRRHSRSPGRHKRSPGRHKHSSGRHSRSSSRHSSSSSQHSSSSSRHSGSSSRHSHSPVRHSRSQSQYFQNLDSETSGERGLHITVDKERYGTEVPKGKEMSDKLGSTVDSLSDANRNDLAVGPMFSSHHSHPQGTEQYPSHEKDLLSPFNIKNEEDYGCRDTSIYGIKCDYLQNQPREDDVDGKPLRSSLDSSDDKSQELKHHQYNIDYRLPDTCTETQGFLPRTQDYCKPSLARSRSPTYEELREFEIARRKREEELLRRNMSENLPDNDYMAPSSNNPLQSSEPWYFYSSNEATAKPLKSILKNRMDDPSAQPEFFSNTSASVSKPMLSSKITDSFSLEMENFIKHFHKNISRRPSLVKEPQGTGTVPDWQLYSDQQKNTFSSEYNSGSFLTQKEHQERISEPIGQQSHFLHPPEKVSRESSSFSRILGMTADSSSIQEKVMYGLADIEDEEKFLYGDDETSSIPPCTSELTLNAEKGPGNQKVASPPPPSQPTTSDTSEKYSPDYEKIHDLLKTIGLDIGLAEIGKLAARTQERLHGKKPSRSPDRHLVSTRRPASRERCLSRSNTLSPESSRKRSLSPPGSFLPSKDYTMNKTKRCNESDGIPEQLIPSAPVIPSAPPSLHDFPPNAASLAWYNLAQFSPFAAPPLPQNNLSLTMPPPGFGAYEQYMAYAAASWPMCAPPGALVLPATQALPTKKNKHCYRPNLKAVAEASGDKRLPEMKKVNPGLVQIPSTVPFSEGLPEPVLQDGKEKTSDEIKLASQRWEVMMERKKLKVEEKRLQTQLYNLRTELSRLTRQQVKMLQVKRKKEDLLLIEVTNFRKSISEKVAQLERKANDAEKKRSELEKVAQSLGIDTSEKSETPSSEKTTIH